MGPSSILGFRTLVWGPRPGAWGCGRTETPALGIRSLVGGRRRPSGETPQARKREGQLQDLLPGRRAAPAAPGTPCFPMGRRVHRAARMQTLGSRHPEAAKEPIRGARSAEGMPLAGHATAGRGGRQGPVAPAISQEGLQPRWGPHGGGRSLPQAGLGCLPAGGAGRRAGTFRPAFGRRRRQVPPPRAASSLCAWCPTLAKEKDNNNKKTQKRKQKHLFHKILVIFPGAPDAPLALGLGGGDSSGCSSRFGPAPPTLPARCFCRSL